MQIQFYNPELEKIYRHMDKGKSKYSEEVRKQFNKTILILMMADDLADIRSVRGLHFEFLKGDFKGKYSVQVNKKYRIILRMEKDRILVEDIPVIEDLTNHHK
jgi:plasmid maintenance system killer protein